MSQVTKEIPLAALVKSKLNARRTTSKTASEELKASILAHGLLQNLVVVRGLANVYEVIAGARRLDALIALQKEGKLPNALVRCEIVDREDAGEMSLAENTVRQDMHPADEFEAFTALATNKSTPLEIAGRFGTTEKHVMQRLKMGKVHPEIIKQYRAEKISLECVMAFTVTDDQEQQLKIFKSLKDWERHPSQIRSRAASKFIQANMAIVKFIGLQAYKDAGGKITQDLFGEASYLTDKKIVDNLFAKKVNITVEKLKKEGWAWVEVGTKSTYSFVTDYGRVKGESKESKAKAGCYVRFDTYNGQLEVEKGLVKRSAPKAVKATPAIRNSQHAINGVAEENRRQIERLALIRSSGLLLDYMCFRAAWDVMHDGYNDDDRGFELNFGAWSSDTIKLSAELTEIKKSLNKKWYKKDSVLASFHAFMQIPQADRTAFLIWAAADTIETGLYIKETPYEAVLSMTGVDVAKQWRPTKENFFDHLQEEDILFIGKDIFGNAWADERKDLGKEKLAIEMHNIFANPDKLNKAETIEKVKKWLPAGMDFQPEKKTVKKKKAA